MIPSLRAEHALRRESGQGMVEYALILALIVIGAVVALGLLGGQVSSFFTQLLNLMP